MDPKILVSARCVSCGGKGLPKTLRPYCSVVCRILGHSGLAWRTNPYRVVDIEFGTQVGFGHDFDFTTKGIAEIQNHADRVQVKAQMGEAA